MQQSVEVLYRDQVVQDPDTQGLLNIGKLINIIHYINKLKKESDVLLSIDALKNI